MFRGGALLALVAVLLVGCGAGDSSDWRKAELPAGMVASSLAADGEFVLIGGHTAEGAPRLVQFDPQQRFTEIELVPTEPYAASATLESVSVAGDALFAIGRAIGGAHSNPRLTVWDGSLTANQLTSRPQEFFTFGGHDAGPLLGTYLLSGEPVIFGSGTTTSGSQGRIWTRRGTAWQKAAVSSPTSSAERQFGFTAATVAGDQLMVVGDELQLTGGLRQSPAAFVGGLSGDWSVIRLPATQEQPASGGQLSRATSVACAMAKQECWVAGWSGGRALVWQLSSTHGTWQAAAPVRLPGEVRSGVDPSALVALLNGRPVVLTNAADPSLEAHCPAGWRSHPAPPGTATALVAADGELLAITDQGLWRLPGPLC